MTMMKADPKIYYAMIVYLGPPQIEYLSAERASKEECRALGRYAARLFGVESVSELDLTGEGP
jgi:hypothetical protein